MSRRPSRLSAVAVWLGVATAAAAADPPPPAVLHLADAGRLPGRLVASDDPAVWRWQSPAFARPLDFPLTAVRSVEYAVPPAAPKPAGEYSVELVGGDVVYGDLAAITVDAVDLTGTAAGPLRLRRDQVRRLSRWNGNGTVYVGPTGLAGWTRADGHWREDGGRLVTDRPGADLFADLGVPDKALVEVGLSWAGKPDFALAVGTVNTAEAVRQAFRFEVWDGQLVAVGESAKDADLAVIQPAGAGGQARVRVLLDQTQRRLTVLGPTGKAVAALSIGGAKPPARGGVNLVNGKGDVRLEHLRVARWDGRPPPEVPEGKPWLSRTDGTVVPGAVTAYDPAAKRFTVRDGEADTAVPHDAVADVYAAPPAAGREPAARPVRVVLRDGTTMSGRAAGVTDGHLALDCPGVAGPVRLPLAAVRSVVLARAGDAPAPAADGRPGRLEADGLSLPGRLVGPAGDGGPLWWQPGAGRAPSPLAAGFAGRIVYRDPTPQPATPVPFAPGKAPAPVLIRNANAPQPVAAPVVRLPSSGRKSLHLRIGDALPCEVSRIDERGVTLTSPQSDITFVPHGKIKSVELVAARDAPGLDEAKRDRLLTLPRSQRDSPPTHLVCSTTGDFLRGRVVGMDATSLQVEVRLETKTVPRDRVAQVVWLHPDELAADPPAPPAAGPPGVRVQVVHPDGSRLTFAVAGSDGKIITGTSEVLGGCRVAVADVNQVLVGGAVARSAADLAYHPWRLRPAAEPKAALAGDGDGPSGLDSPLVGKPAPDFELKLLDGTPYKLAGRKGKVVVLDFWASWCGPCVQSMPLVDEAVREFADRGVELLAVNLEEPAERARGLLDRLKLTVPVALDRDGAVAAKYGVTSLPQAVVIGRDGTVARLYTDGGKATAEALRAALKELTAKPPD